eukprot:CAMPEP_0174370042 /NCGR_PEP_ID=MMETSP0811_2-20130205/94756_1 /TAXON_ID=73025 ORGANISM="Eutreptiella gymnastica-like, Strain CCMP1594" /NCGR_SAMPLE_ID=MMETSP0811_2 /ASSEMBLY_ACC=CAM_ASM_000667 /LENGTH=105 /DNA_ID=CAMNT_0015515093 /DNA_START=167 /DNA_END=484 /DNA_ORIENTATION=+
MEKATRNSRQQYIHPKFVIGEEKTDKTSPAGGPSGNGHYPSVFGGQLRPRGLCLMGGPEHQKRTRCPVTPTTPKHDLNRCACAGTCTCATEGRCGCPCGSSVGAL